MLILCLFDWVNVMREKDSGEGNAGQEIIYSNQCTLLKVKSKTSVQQQCNNIQSNECQASKGIQCYSKVGN